MSTTHERIFPPTSILWRVARENVLLMGGPAAAILQIAHPQVALGVARHSNFREDTLGRLHRTLEAVYTITFGRREEIEAMAAQVRASHERVKGEEPQRYSAFDLDAQFWVLATLMALSIEIYERVVSSLTEDEKDIYLREMKAFGSWFGLPEDFGPQSWAEFQAYYEKMLNLPEMGARPECPELARHIIYPQRPLVLRPGWPITSVLTREFLPSPVRERLGLLQTAGHRLAARTLLGMIRASLPMLPGPIRFVPRYLAARRAEAM